MFIRYTLSTLGLTLGKHFNNLRKFFIKQFNYLHGFSIPNLHEELL